MVKQRKQRLLKRKTWKELRMARQTVYLRIPVKREGFVDPPVVKWSEAKEQQLWSIISKSKRTEVDWNSLSTEFQVPITFLQQQVFWLYEQELEQLKSKIQKGAISSETVTESTALHQKGTDSPPIESHHEIFTKNHQSLSSQGFKSHQTLRRQNVEGQPIESDDDTTDSTGHSSDDDDYDDDGNGLDHGSMLLHRSRILSKVAPRFKDIVGEADDKVILEESEDSGIIIPHKVATESSMSNLSSVSISKSALEEALLEAHESNSHF